MVVHGLDDREIATFMATLATIIDNLDRPKEQP
jgi:hypothetical protein